MTRRGVWAGIGALALFVAAAVGFVVGLEPSRRHATPLAAEDSASASSSPAFAATGPAPLASADEAPAGAGPFGEGAPLAGPHAVRVSGSLVFVGDGRRFGEETYTLTVGDEGMELASSGVFEARVLLATVRARFTQSLAGDSLLRPTAYSLRLDAPLGFHRDLAGRIGSDGSVAVAGQDGGRATVDPNRAFVLGTFSTYALLPVAFRARERDGVASFDVLTFFGAADERSGNRNPSDGSIQEVTVERLGEGTIQADGKDLSVDRYRVRSREGETLLLAKDEEFLGLLADDGKHALVVYRSDLFPTGFQVRE